MFDIIEVVAVKLGALGALASKHSELTRAQSNNVNDVDTVGTVDIFDAGLLYGYLNNWPIDKSLRLACVCRGLSMQKTGGTEGQPTLDEETKYVS